MDTEVKLHLAAVTHELHVIKARAMAQDAVHNALLRCWGEPVEAVIPYLETLAERIEATGLPTAAPEAALDAVREVFAQALLAARGGPPRTQ